MPRVDTTRPGVEQRIREYLRVDTLVFDDDGDIALRRGPVLFFVRLLDGEPPLVRLFSVVAERVPPSPQLFELLNDVNAENLLVRFFWAGGDVLVVRDLTTDTMEVVDLARSCDAVAAAAEQYQARFLDQVGGSSGFDQAAFGLAVEV